MPTDEQYREAARETEDMHRISIDDSPKIERDTGGAWVCAWIWVADRDIKDGNENGQFGVGA